MITFSVPGEPRGWQRVTPILRQKAGMAALKISAIVPEQTRSYKKSIGEYAWVAMGGRPILENAVYLEFDAIFSVPKSWSMWKRRDALLGRIHHTGKPDGDNVLKSLKDGMKGIVYADDSQVVKFIGTKRYGAEPMITVTVGEL